MVKCENGKYIAAEKDETGKTLKCLEVGGKPDSDQAEDT